MVTIFVRHSADCPQKNDEFYKRCKCPKHLRWYYEKKLYRQATKTRSWSLAEDAKRKLEARFDEGATSTAPDLKERATIKRAVDLFIEDKKSQGIKSDVLKKYRRELDRFSSFMAIRNRMFPNEVRLEDVTEFRSGWEEQYESSTTRGKVQGRLKSFFRYCYEAKMIERVPKLSSIKVDRPPTLPLTDKEYQALLDVTPDEFKGDKAKRVRALIQTMRHTGLAIQDTVTLKRTELIKDRKLGRYRITTSRQKTGTHVSVLLHPEVEKEILEAIPLNESKEYIFWNTGRNKPQTAVTNWQHDLRQVFRAAGLPKGHPHQLRDTFAIDLLKKGVPLEEVSKLLGHSSIKTTERDYAAWVPARQSRLDALMEATFA